MGIIKFNDKYKHNKDIDIKNMKWIQNDNDLCIICYGDNGQRDTILKPCGHKLCAKDTKNIIRRRMSCPICRSKIVSAQTIQS